MDQVIDLKALLVEREDCDAGTIQKLREGLAQGGTQFKALKEKHPIVGDARGLGMMQALELVKDRKTKEPNPAAVGKVFEEAKRRCVLLGKGGVYGNVIRTGLMLNAGKSQVDELVEAIDAGLTVAAAG